MQCTLIVKDLHKQQAMAVASPQIEKSTEKTIGNYSSSFNKPYFIQESLGILKKKNLTKLNMYCCIQQVLGLKFKHIGLENRL